MSYEPNAGKYMTHANIANLLTQWLAGLKTNIDYNISVYEMASEIDSFVAFQPQDVRKAMEFCRVCQHPLYSRHSKICTCHSKRDPIKYTEQMIIDSEAYSELLKRSSCVSIDRSMSTMNMRAKLKRKNLELALHIVSYLQDVMEAEGMSFFKPTIMTLHHAKPDESRRRKPPTPVLETKKPGDSG